MSASAGRVLLIPRGVYNASETYTPLDMVKYGVSTYLCKAETTGNVPTNTAYWQLFAEGVENVSPEAIGIGVAISSDTGSSRTAVLTDYNLTPNGIVAVTFASDVPANATLNINSQGAKAIYYRGSALVANVIRGGDTVTFGYDGTRYNVLCIDGGAGHEIENSAGTKLTQRDVMQVLDGLEAVDDSTNQKTKIKMNLPIVSSADWNAMTEQEKTAYKASHYRFGVEVPDTEGVINAEYMKLLWENPNTTTSFPAQTITLNSADYDYLLIIFNYISSSGIAGSVLIRKGQSTRLGTVSGTTGVVFLRDATYVSDTSYTFNTAYKNDGTTDNNRCIPIAIYGIKKNFQFKVNAIATDLSTSADHCMLSDDETSVEEAITYKDVYSTDEHIVGKWINRSVLYEKTVDFGALPNATSKGISHNISNLGKIVEIEGVANYNDTIFYPLPYVTNSLANQIQVIVNRTLISINTGADYSEWNGYVTLRYTKTS